MPLYPRGDASFIVRIWWERPVDGRPIWRGQVIHVLGQESAYFQTVQELVAFCEQWTGALSSKPDMARDETPPGEGGDHV
ncbi:MAG: hypothetical protein D6790_08620 [Caldilineae bacterium]|nr:MAG: hypothetical protein D6790_08620 [Caldilineae bacterium]